MRLPQPFLILFFLLGFGLWPVAQAAPEACPSTTTEENKAVVGRFFDVLNQQDVEALDELVVAHHVHHPGTSPDSLEGRDAYRRYLEEELFGMFPDLHLALEQTLAEGDLVATRWTARSFYEGAQPGAATPLVWTGIAIFRLECGRVAEAWFEADHLHRLQQMAVLPENE
jgi:predicted ester cyclase